MNACEVILLLLLFKAHLQERACALVKLLSSNVYCMGDGKLGNASQVSVSLIFGARRTICVDSSCAGQSGTFSQAFLKKYRDAV